MCTAAEVLSENLQKIQLQDLTSFLYVNKSCWSSSDHQLCFFVLEHPQSFSFKHLSSALLESELLSLKSLSSLLLDSSLTCNSRVSTSTALSFRAQICVTSLCIKFVFRTADTVIALDESWGKVWQLKQITRNEFCSIDLIVKSLIFLTWLMLLTSQTSWLKETSCLSQQF